MKKMKLTPEAAAKEWIALKAQEKALDERLDELKAVLEPALRAVPEKTIDYHGFRFSLVEFERESFSLSKAKEKMSLKVLRPFISKSPVVSIRATWQGGGVEAIGSAAA